MRDILAIDRLTVVARDGTTVLNDVSCGLRPGGRLAVVGESGVGKTTLALAALGVVRPGLRRKAGSVSLAGHDIFALSETARRRLRRHTIAWLGQDPAAALTPAMPVGRQIAELLGRPSPDLIGERLRAVSLPDDEEFRRRLPGQLSGGQQRRVALARALAARPRLVVLDEPTAGLDPVAANAVVTEIDRLRAELGSALLVITHDLDLASRMGDEHLVLSGGRVLPGTIGPPVRPRRIPATTPATHAAPAVQNGTPLLRICGLSAAYGSGDVLHEVSFGILPGTCTAVLGPSGSGKSTLARVVAGLHPPSGGDLQYDDVSLPALARDRGRAQRAAIQLVPQDPYGALHPRRSALASVARPLRVLHGESRRSATAIATELLARVGLSSDDGRRRPAELSGGQRQRVVLARALAAQPRVLVCDEITSALDSSTSAAVLDLIDRLRADRQLAVVFITHELHLAARVADRVVVFDDGLVRESGPAADVLAAPRHPVTVALVEAARSAAAGHPPAIPQGAPS